MAGHDRYDYSAIVDRPAFNWPDGKRLAVYIGLNLETFSFGDGLGAELAPGGPQPDVLNYAWRDYGNRVGVWRMGELLASLDLPVSLLLNSDIYRHCPEVIVPFRQRGDEIVAHGRTNAERQSIMSETAEAAMIDDVTDTIRAHEARAPAGWLSPWIAESHVTPDLLAEAGYRYTLNWCHDDQPTRLRTRNGQGLLAVPYPQEINDIPAIIARRLEARAFADMIVDQFDEMRRQAEDQPLVMGIALHAYIMGQPHRLLHLRRALSHVAKRDPNVWLCTSGAIADHMLAESPP
ncbi:Peptidoglycan/xylan/chitin deacetylase, PgdA/CDA1 family [Arboricoccus pini]|uniref:Peptidoglycan/xylan/chitin deacetylase, PgdA/CDA1 family n=1 Tax=Arboricoccus pini TaxID=1963835 RepID=A0A212RD77_9PROT|nr:polysaccharide deacetylase family protein [Arboricoccus pini]SNB70183.1 Peptidoglycan/xylan/chitin deacetylase, PgdA/CDA1 family [Arboricoccus pini]